MKLRLSPTLIWRFALAILALYFVGSVVFLLSISFPSTRAGLTALQQGQQQLLKNPQEASKDFQTASLAFEESVEKLQNTPFALKILTPLPPFRWHVRLVKATHELASAGLEASQLSAKGVF